MVLFSMKIAHENTETTGQGQGVVVLCPSNTAAAETVAPASPLLPVSTGLAAYCYHPLPSGT